MSTPVDSRTCETLPGGVGFKHGEFCDFDIEEALAMQKNISNYMIEVAGDMSK